MLQPGVNVTATISGSGPIKRDSGLFTNHLFNVGLQKPQILESLLIKYPKYYLLKILDKIGASRDLYNDTFNWTVMDRTRAGGTISALAAGVATVTLTVPPGSVDVPNDHTGYFLPGDIIYAPKTNKRAIVTAVAPSGTSQNLTLVNVDGTVAVIADFPVGAKIGHAGTSFGQGSAGSGGFRSYLPGQEYNVTTIARRGIKVTRSAMKDKTVLDDGTWWFKAEDFEQKEFMKDVEATTFLGTRYKSSTIGGRSLSKGLLEYATDGGNIVTYAAATGAKETDLRTLAEKLVPQQGSDEIFLACGIKLFSELQAELGNNYRTTPTSLFRTQTGIDVQSYEFFGKKFSLAFWDILNDQTILPTETAGAVPIDFTRFGIALDFGRVEGGGANIEMGWLDKMSQKAITGMGSDSYEISNAFDGCQFELLAEFMPIVYMPNRLGIIRANS